MKPLAPSKKVPNATDNRSWDDMNSWRFDQPRNCAVLTTTHVIKEGQDITCVFHDADDHGWQLHSEGGKTVAEHLVVSLGEIVRHDPSVLEVADLPPGWKAWRKEKEAAWRRAEVRNKEEGKPDGTGSSGG